MPRLAVLALTLGPAICVALPASAAKLRVPADHATLQAAVDAAMPGDVIDVAKGEYAEAVVVQGKSRLTLRGKGRPALDGQGLTTPLTIQDSDQITVMGFAFENAPEALVSVADTSNVTIQRCTFRNPTEDGNGIEVRSSAALVVQKNVFENVGNDAIVFEEDSLPLSTDALVSKNRFAAIGDEAIDVTGSGHRIEKNRIARAEHGIELEGATATTVEKNRVEDTEDTCIQVDGAGNVVAKNKVRRCDDEGIHLTGPNNRVERNKIDAPGDDGIDVESDDNEVVANKVKGAADAGIEVEDEVDTPGTGTGNLFEANKITKSGDAGIHVSTGGNTFRRNKVAKSGVVDLLDDSLSGTNVYESNKFGTEQIDAP